MALVLYHDELTRSAREAGAMQWHSNSLGGDHRYAWITVSGSSRARNQQNFIFATPRRCPSFRADCPLATKPDAMPILDERSLPPERGGRTNRAAKLEMIACSGTRPKNTQMEPPAGATLWVRTHKSIYGNFGIMGPRPVTVWPTKRRKHVEFA